jgi:Mg2+/Co2+ transporter CorB
VGDDHPGFLSRLLRRLGRRPHSQPLARLPAPHEELRDAVHEAIPGRPRSRQAMLASILELDRMTVNDIMVPRNEVIGIDLEHDLEQIVAQLRSTAHTRLPVYRHDLNQIEGVVHMRRIARLLTSSQPSHELLRNACVEPYFVPENTPLSTQLINFQKHKRRLGMVVDEYGEVIGLVTLEDILEEIVGEFTTQPGVDAPEIHAQDDGSYVIDGSASIREVNRELHWHLPSDGPKTINGLVTEALENLPDSSVCLKIGPYRLEILHSEENRATQVRIWRNAGGRTAQAPTG